MLEYGTVWRSSFDSNPKDCSSTYGFHCKYTDFSRPLQSTGRHFGSPPSGRPWSQGVQSCMDGRSRRPAIDWVGRGKKLIGLIEVDLDRAAATGDREPEMTESKVGH